MGDGGGRGEGGRGVAKGQMVGAGFSRHLQLLASTGAATAYSSALTSAAQARKPFGITEPAKRSLEQHAAVSLQPRKSFCISLSQAGCCVAFSRSRSFITPL